MKGKRWRCVSCQPKASPWVEKMPSAETKFAVRSKGKVRKTIFFHFQIDV
ncbi:hypothetical protein HMPREF0658_1558 [Hoylesella marshii DSM 16973 = JCM 13450]|uniref:Uncharacterized protein n=1 Tax=Hoylesella marshii DSM 16973 = JCM 13450 TaxID=862515 RepID=E0NTQ5_9BACT|nr:hypothetical protein HMPREF0658_1558 [Hoylesella marshii DSM 16973 = JCM 13450]